MEEDQYKSIYRSVNQQKCVFEKAINTRRCGCARSHRFCLADREGVACNSPAALDRCTAFLGQLRDRARFALHQPTIGGPLPHTKEIKVQLGGVHGLAHALAPGSATPVPDIDATLCEALGRFETIADLPYCEIMHTLVHFELRARRGSPRPG